MTSSAYEEMFVYGSLQNPSVVECRFIQVHKLWQSLVAVVVYGSLQNRSAVECRFIQARKLWQSLVAVVVCGSLQKRSAVECRFIQAHKLRQYSTLGLELCALNTPISSCHQFQNQ